MRSLGQQDQMGNSWPSLLPTTITTPQDGATGVSVLLSLLLTVAPLGVTGGTDTAASVDWEIRTAPGGGGSLVWGTQVSNPLSILTALVPALTLSPGRDYYIRARANGAAMGEGVWSADVRIRT